MKCPSCQTENPDNVKFCGECGAKLQSGSSSSQMSFTGQKTTMPKQEESKPANDGKSLTGQKTLDKIPVETEEKPETWTESENPSKRYKTIDKLGEGGMGKVFKMQDQKLGRIVAMKRLQMKEQV